MQRCTEEKLIKYLQNLDAYCNRYDTFAIPASRIATLGKNIRLQDVYTGLHLKKGEGRYIGNAGWSPSFMYAKEENIPLRITLVLAEPGGGKTTLLKWCARALAGFILGNCPEDLPDFLWDLLGDIDVSDVEIPGMGKLGKYIPAGKERKKIPVLIHLKEISYQKVVDFDKKLSCADIENMIKAGAAPFMPDDNAEGFLERETEYVLLLDGLDELDNVGQMAGLYYGLQDFYRVYPNVNFIISSRTSDYEDFSSSDAYWELPCTPCGVEYEIGRVNGRFGFDSVLQDVTVGKATVSFEWIRVFAEKWFWQLLQDEEQSIKRTEEFVAFLKKNDRVLDLLTGPLELTNLLLLSDYDNTLPSDLNQLLEKSVELRLSWANDGKFYQEDTKLQLAGVAYYMTLKGANIISKEELLKLIRERRQDFAGYYMTEQGCEDEEIETFLGYILKSGIFKKEYRLYEFVNRQYRDYFTALCVKENYFPRKEIKKNRLDYLKEPIKTGNNDWEQVILLTAMSDHRLQNAIIEELFSLCVEDEKRSSYLETLLYLASFPGIYLEEAEQEKICQMILRNEYRLHLLYSEHFKAMFRTNSGKLNTWFVGQVFCLYEQTQTTEAKEGRLSDAWEAKVFLGCPLLYMALCCELEKEEIKRIFEAFYDIYPDALYQSMSFQKDELWDSLKEGKCNPQVVQILQEMEKEQSTLWESFRNMKEVEDRCYARIEECSEAWEMIRGKGAIEKYQHPYEWAAELSRTEVYENHYVAALLYRMGISGYFGGECPPLQDEKLEEELKLHYKEFMERSGKEEDVRELQTFAEGKDMNIYKVVDEAGEKLEAIRWWLEQLQ